MEVVHITPAPRADMGQPGSRSPLTVCPMRRSMVTVALALAVASHGTLLTMNGGPTAAAEMTGRLSGSRARRPALGPSAGLDRHSMRLRRLGRIFRCSLAHRCALLRWGDGLPSASAHRHFVACSSVESRACAACQLTPASPKATA